MVSSVGLGVSFFVSACRESNATSQWKKQTSNICSINNNSLEQYLIRDLEGEEVYGFCDRGLESCF
jgi:hypothetical protein